MPIYDYQCQKCSAYHEVICSMGQRKDEIECPRCKGTAEQVILSAPGLMTGGMTNVSQDVAIGRDAEKRWDRIHESKAGRDKIRRESGKANVTAVADGSGGIEFKPSDKKLRFVATPEPKDD
jgi:putative FmdB family regulatory protein